MRIIVADDDPDLRQLAVRALEQEFERAEIVELIRKEDLDRVLSDASADILVTDLDLRWATGFDMLSSLRLANPDCTAIMFTGTGNEEVAVRALKAGFDDYLVKGIQQFKRLAASTRVAHERRRERRELGENRDLLLKELYHRLHNNLQIVVSLMGMSARSVADPEAKREVLDLSRRVQSLSALQEQLLRSPDFREVDFATYVERLGRDLTALGGGRIAFEADLKGLTLPVDTAIPLALIANELMLDAVKHAFPGKGRGTLRAAVHDIEGGFALVIEDDGAGEGRELTGSRAALARHLVKRLAEQIAAEVSFMAGSAGARCQVKLSR